ncbi:Ultraviolet-B receptor UVR8 [Diplonema papillatum]|nr:Ultraviolet-B receptor UVR8 [Diplonema papillatum]
MAARGFVAACCALALAAAQNETNTTTLTASQTASASVSATSTGTETVVAIVPPAAAATRTFTATATDPRPAYTADKTILTTYISPEQAAEFAVTFKLVRQGEVSAGFAGVVVTPSCTRCAFSPTSALISCSDPTDPVVCALPDSLDWTAWGIVAGTENIDFRLSPANSTVNSVPDVKVILPLPISVKPLRTFDWRGYEYFKGMYPTDVSPPLKVQLSELPAQDLTLTFVPADAVPSSPAADNTSITGFYGLTFTPTTLEFSPGSSSDSLDIQIVCAIPGIYPITTLLTGTDLHTYSNVPTWDHECLARIPLALRYTGLFPFDDNVSGNFLLIPEGRHRDYIDFDLVVSCASDPAGVVFTPEHVVVTSEVGATFTARGSAGRYRIVCTRVLWPTSPSTKTTGSDNTAYFDPDPIEGFIIHPKNEVNFTEIPVLRLMTSLVRDSMSGGGWSPVLTLKLENPPRVDFTIRPFGFDLKSYPEVLAFTALDSELEFRIRLTTLRSDTQKLLSFEYDGANKRDFAPLDPIYLDVTGRNPDCAREATELGCLALWDEMCWWDAGDCRNDLIPFTFLPSNYSSQFENQVRPYSIRPVAMPVHDVTVTFVGDYLTFTDEALLWTGAGSTDTSPPAPETRSYTLSGRCPKGVTLTLQATYLLSGTDFHHYEFPEPQDILIKRLIKVKTPSTPEYPFMYVLATSMPLTVSIENAPPTSLTLTVQAPDSVIFEPSIFLFTPTVTERTFTVTTTTDTGTYNNITWLQTGADASQYAQADWATIKVFEKIPVRTTLAGTLGDEAWSAFQYVQAEVPPMRTLRVTIAAVSENDYTTELSTKLVQLRAPGVDSTVPANNITLEFAPDVRTVAFQVRGMTSGHFGLRFELSGLDVDNYIPPHHVEFWVSEPKAWEYTQGQSGVDPVCRVAVGRLDFNSLGIEDANDESCSINDKLNPDDLCYYAESASACASELFSNGYPCIWNETTSACSFGLPNGNVTHYAVGESHSIFRLLDGTIWSAGSNQFGQLGHSCNELLGCNDSVAYQEVLFEYLDDAGDCKEFESDGKTCVKISSPEMKKRGIMDYVSFVVVGATHSMALTVGGQLYAWGANNHGQLGITTLRQAVTVPSRVLVPNRPLIEEVVCIASGAYHSVAISDTGEVYVWGWNYFGQLAHAPSYRGSVKVPVTITDVIPELADDPPVSVAAGDYHTMLATASGKVFTWGRNNYGQLGRIGFDDLEPVVVAATGGSVFRGASCPIKEKVNYDSWPESTDFTLGRQEQSIYDKVSGSV